MLPLKVFNTHCLNFLERSSHCLNFFKKKLTFITTLANSKRKRE